MNSVVLPVLIPMLTGLLALWSAKPTALRRAFIALSAAGQLGWALHLAVRTYEGGAIALSVGGWGSAVGIVLVVDLLAAIMLSLSAFTALACVLFACAERAAVREHPLQLPLVQFLVTGVNLSFVTGDLFNLFVAFEVMLISSYALLTLESDNRNVRHAWSYLAINLVGSAVFLVACGWTYGLFGTLNFAGIAVAAEAMAGDARVTLLALVLLAVFAIKAGLFPLYYWLPNSYPILPGPVAAFFSGMLTKVGVYVLLRIFGTVFPPTLPVVHELLAWAAGLTMVFGVLGAVAQTRVQHILSYHIISQIGFMVLAIGFFTPVAIAAAILYITHHIVVKSTLFLVGGTVRHVFGHDELARTGGLWRAAPWLGLAFLVQALSLAGLPPLSGFWGKYLIIVVGLEQGEWVLIALSVVASILTLVSMLKIWLACFWAPAPTTAGVPRVAGTRRLTAVTVGMAVVSLGIGLGVPFFYRVAERAAQQVLDRSAYVEVVTGRLPPAKLGSILP
jgi:multicomponent Na+:H+ antiporter subunit D